MTWDAQSYLKFGDERTRPSVDLVGRISLEDPASVIDLGCGPGNSTEVLRRRWPHARVVGLDSSVEMIEAARSSHPGIEWIVGDIASWEPDAPFDVVYSNAALQWLPGHGPLVGRLFERVAPGGALAFQIPSAAYARVRALIEEVAREPEWADRMRGPLGSLTIEAPESYYDALAPLARVIDMWETQYVHVLESPKAIVEWMSSTGLRPFLEVLATDADRDRFVAMLLDRVAESYPRRVDGRVLFPFRRLFVIAYA